MQDATNDGYFVIAFLLETAGHGRRQIPSIGPIRAVLLLALIQTPHRFRSNRQPWAYSGLALETRNSGEYRMVRGQLKRPKRVIAIRGLNKHHNHDLKNIFKGAAMRGKKSSSL